MQEALGRSSTLLWAFTLWVQFQGGEVHGGWSGGERESEKGEGEWERVAFTEGQAAALRLCCSAGRPTGPPPAARSRRGRCSRRKGSPDSTSKERAPERTPGPFGW